jgi:hypothetical protein
MICRESKRSNGDHEAVTGSSDDSGKQAGHAAPKLQPTWLIIFAALSGALDVGLDIGIYPVGPLREEGDEPVGDDVRQRRLWKTQHDFAAALTLLYQSHALHMHAYTQHSSARMHAWADRGKLQALMDRCVVYPQHLDLRLDSGWCRDRPRLQKL